MSKQYNITQALKLMIVQEAQRWVGVTEKGGNNKGQIVEMFQKVVDNKAGGEPWCMGAVQSWAYWALQYFKIAHAPVASQVEISLFKSEHCMTVWNNTDKAFRLAHPEPGAVVIWNYEGTASGHTGVVVSVEGANMWTIEGNTGDGSGIVREGDGVYMKKRSLKGEGKMKLVGFLDPVALRV